MNVSEMTIEEIKEYLPHRFPFLLIDRIVSFEKDKRIVALKNVTVNEPFFPGHFPHYHVMPGVLIVEAMAQAAAVLSLKSLGLAKFTAVAKVGDAVAAEAELLCALREL